MIRLGERFFSTVTEVIVSSSIVRPVYIQILFIGQTPIHLVGPKGEVVFGTR